MCSCVKASGRDGARLGERAWVRIDAGRSPLVWQLAQQLRRQVSRHFNAQI